MSLAVHAQDGDPFPTEVLRSELRSVDEHSGEDQIAGSRASEVRRASYDAANKHIRHRIMCLHLEQQRWVLRWILFSKQWASNPIANLKWEGGHGLEGNGIFQSSPIHRYDHFSAEGASAVESTLEGRLETGGVRRVAASQRLRRVLGIVNLAKTEHTVLVFE